MDEIKHGTVLSMTCGRLAVPVECYGFTMVMGGDGWQETRIWQFWLTPPANMGRHKSPFIGRNIEAHYKNG